MKHHLHRLIDFVILPFSIVLFCSFNGKNITIDSHQANLHDTIPFKESNDSSNVELLAGNRTAAAQLVSDSVAIRTESEYPGGRSSWMRFLARNFRYPKHAMDNNVEGLVIVKFTVDEKGRVKNIDPLIGPKELRQEAARVIKASGRWIPARENGKAVKSEKEQSITFKREYF